MTQPTVPQLGHLRQLIALDRLLRGASGTRAELAVGLEERTGVPVSERTISRYMDELAALWGLTTRYDRAERRYVYEHPRRKLPVGLFLSTDAWLMAEWLASVVGAAPDTPAKLRGALAQLRGGRHDAALPASFRTLPRPARLQRADGALDAVERWWHAAQDRRVVAFRYPTRDHGGDLRPRRVEPHGLAFVGGLFQLDGWDVDRGDWRTFLPIRMRGLEETGADFARRDWKPDEVFAGAFRRKRGPGDHRIVVELTERVAFMVRDLEQHPSQELLGGAPVGWVRVRFRLSHLHEVLDWVLSLGSQARVVEPPALRDLVRAELAAMHALYDGEDAP